MNTFRELAEMMRDRVGIFLGIIIMTVGCATRECRAGFMFLGPTPYRSAADSPFPVGGTNANFHLEDFEDGELNTPGIFQPIRPDFGTRFHGSVLGPGAAVDSVDSDDGVIDGMGRIGHSFRSGSHLIHSTLPIINQLSIDFEFSEAELGYLPNSLGFVVTDVPHGPDWNGQTFFNFRFTDALGELHVLSSILLPDDGERTGGIGDDYFFGVTGIGSGIRSFSIAGVTYGQIVPFDYIEIDHLQFGSIPIPEPRSLVLIASAVLIMRGSRAFARCICQPAARPTRPKFT